MKQIITFYRTETITLRVEVLQKLSAKAQEAWANQGGLGGIASPVPGEMLAHGVTDWRPEASQGKAKKGARRG